MLGLALMGLILGTGCPQSQDIDTDQGDGYGDETSIRISSPAEGATVSPGFQVRFSTGASVDLVRALVDNEAATSFLDAEGLRSVDLSADPGRHTVSLVAYTADRAELSRDEVHLKVVSESAEGWVSIVTPPSGSSPVEPVQVVVDASANVVEIRVYAEDRLLGEVGPEGVFTADFASTGTPRPLEVRAYDDLGELLATDVVDITPEAATDPGASDYNELVLALMGTYPTDGTYTYYWPSSGSWSGSTRDLWYRGTLVADDGGYSACYCSGITWELYLRTWMEWDGQGDDLNGLSAGEVLEMRRDWYVRELDGPGPSTALEGQGLGVEVRSFAHWRPGDFIQLWRTTGSGHTVVFDGWIYDTDGNIVGMDYVSCQGSTDGYGWNTEYFGPFEGALDPLLMFAGRGLMPTDWY